MGQRHLTMSAACFGSPHVPHEILAQVFCLPVLLFVIFSAFDICLHHYIQVY